MNGPLRVAYVCTDPGVPVFGRKGASVHVQSVLRVLVRAGVDVQLVCARTGGTPPPDLAGIPVLPLPTVTGEATRDRERSAAACDAAVPTLLDRLHAERPLDLVLERYALWGRSATAWAAHQGVRSVLEVNAPLPEEQATHRELADRAGAERVAEAAITAATATVCVTEEVARWARAHAGRPERVHVVANGVDTRAIQPPGGEVAPADGPFTVGFVGTLKPWHGIDVLVEALGLLVAEDRSYRLLLVGDGPVAAPALHRCRTLGIDDRVEATGAVAPGDVPALLARMDLAVAPYPALEECYFSPLKVYEYLAAGLPVVASRTGVLPDLLEHGRLGALVTPGSAAELADAVRRLRGDVARRQSIRTAAAAAAADHDWSLVVARVLALVGLDLPGEVDHGALVQAHHVA